MPETRSGKAPSAPTTKDKGRGKKSPRMEANVQDAGPHAQPRENAIPPVQQAPVQGARQQQLDLQGAILALNDNQVATQATLAQQMSHRNADRALMGVPKFGGGRRDNLSAFLRMIDLQEVGEPDLVRNVPKLLHGSALAWYESQPMDVVTSWPRLRRAMREQFAAESQQRSLMKEMEARRYRPGRETPADYIRDMETLGTLCGLGVAEIIQWSRRTLPELLKDYVDDQNPRTTHDVVEAIEKYERREAAERTQRLAEIDVRMAKEEPHLAAEELRKVNARLDAIVATRAAVAPPPQNPVPALMSVDTNGSIMAALNAILTNQQGMQFQQHPQQQKQHQQPRYNQGRFGRNTTGRTGTCRGCGEPGHFIKDCRKTRYCSHCDLGGHFITDCKWAQQGIPTPQCTVCGKKGHDAADCYKVVSPN